MIKTEEIKDIGVTIDCLLRFEKHVFFFFERKILLENQQNLHYLMLMGKLKLPINWLE